MSVYSCTYLTVDFVVITNWPTGNLSPTGDILEILCWSCFKSCLYHVVNPLMGYNWEFYSYSVVCCYLVNYEVSSFHTLTCIALQALDWTRTGLVCTGTSIRVLFACWAASYAGKHSWTVHILFSLYLFSHWCFLFVGTVEMVLVPVCLFFTSLSFSFALEQRYHSVAK